MLFGLVFIQVCLHVLFLYIGLWIVARREADMSFFTLFFIALGIWLGTHLFGIYVVPSLPYPPFNTLLIMPVVLVISMLLLARFCYIDMLKAFLAASIYVVLNIIVAIAFILFLGAMLAS